MVEGVVVGGHAVGGGDGAEGADEIVGSGVAHHADGLDGEEDGEGLPDGVIKARIADFLEIDRIGLTQDFEFFRRDFTGQADGQTRPGKGGGG